MIINKKAPQVGVKASYEHRPSLFAIAASQERANNMMGYKMPENKPQSPPKDFWRADAYFEKEGPSSTSNIAQ